MTKQEKADQFKAATKLWQIAEMGLEDIRIAEKLPGVRVDMWNWCNKDAEESGGKCLVCFAGAVMIGRFKNASDVDFLSPEYFPGDLEAKFNAMDSLRRGSVSEAVGEMVDAGLTDKDESGFEPMDRLMVHYENDREGWYRDMENLLADLKEADI